MIEEVINKRKGIKDFVIKECGNNKEKERKKEKKEKKMHLTIIFEVEV